ncbi:MAG: zinc ribbon domain-containing protein [Methanobacteriota archaeon]
MSIYDTQKRLKAVKHSTIIWLALVFLTDISLAIGMVYSPDGTVALALVVVMAFFTLIIPYMFGEKNVKKMAAAGLVVILVVGLLEGVIYLNALYSVNPEATRSGDSILTEGLVTPYQDVSATNFTYTVVYSGNLPDSLADVRLNVSDIAGGDVELNATMHLAPGENASASSRRYIYQAELPGSMYQYRFETFDNSGNYTTTSSALGPINAPMGQFIAPICLYAVMTMFLQAGMLFFIGLLMYWWLRKGKEERAKWKTELGESKPPKGADFKCTDCGAFVSDDDKFCPKCGVKFDDSDSDRKGDDKGDEKQPEKELGESKPVEYEKSVERPEEGKKP